MSVGPSGGAGARDLGVREKRRPEWKLAREPDAKRAVELLIAAGLEGVGCDPPADVDVEGHQLERQRGTRAHRVEVAAADVLGLVPVHGIRKRAAFAELQLVPNQI